MNLLCCLVLKPYVLFWHILEKFFSSRETDRHTEAAPVIQNLNVDSVMQVKKKMKLEGSFIYSMPKRQLHITSAWWEKSFCPYSLGVQTFSVKLFPWHSIISWMSTSSELHINLKYSRLPARACPLPYPLWCWEKTQPLAHFTVPPSFMT